MEQERRHKKDFQQLATQLIARYHFTFSRIVSTRIPICQGKWVKSRSMTARTIELIIFIYESNEPPNRRKETRPYEGDSLLLAESTVPVKHRPVADQSPTTPQDPKFTTITQLLSSGATCTREVMSLPTGREVCRKSG